LLVWIGVGWLAGIGVVAIVVVLRVGIVGIVDWIRSRCSGLLCGSGLLALLLGGLFRSGGLLLLRGYSSGGGRASRGRIEASRGWIEASGGWIEACGGWIEACGGWIEACGSGIEACRGWIDACWIERARRGWVDAGGTRQTTTTDSAASGKTATN